jgi:tubulin--tyrosine ligase-like protein 12
VVQRYVASPALYRGRKFDVRVLVAVRAFAPRLDALAWDTTYVRAANRPYTHHPAALGDFQTQFTSMRQARPRSTPFSP